MKKIKKIATVLITLFLLTISFQAKAFDCESCSELGTILDGRCETDLQSVCVKETDYYMVNCNRFYSILGCDFE